VNLRRVASLVAKDLRLGPRTPAVHYALLMPPLITFLVQVVLVSLFHPAPRLGIVDLGHSELVAAAKTAPGVEVTVARSASELRALVERNDVDLGLVLDDGFDDALRAGERPALPMYAAGESLAQNRALLAATALDWVRLIERAESPVEVALEEIGDREPAPIDDLSVICVLLFALLVAGIFVPASMLVQEREQGTLLALLVTPARMSEVLFAKAIFGFALAAGIGALTLAMNRAFPAQPTALLASLAVSVVICIEIGLIYATLAKDAKTLFQLVKTLNLLIVAPIFFILFPQLPQWVAKLFPTYWFIEPLYRTALQGATLAEVGWKLAIALGVALLLLPPILLLARRLEGKLAAA